MKLGLEESNQIAEIELCIIQMMPLTLTSMGWCGAMDRSIWRERARTWGQNTVFSVITDILTLIIHIWKVFVGIVFHSAFTWHTSQTQVSTSYWLWLFWQVIFFSTRRLVLTRISCIKLTESKRATDVPLGNSFSIKGAHGLSDCLGRCYGVTEQVTETQQDTAQSLSLPLLSFFLSCTLEPCGSQVGVAQAPGQAVMYLTAPWSRPEGGQGSAWRGCSHTAPNRSSIWVFIHLSSSVGRPWPLAAHQPVTSSPLELPWATFDRHWPLLTGKNKSCTITQILTFACLLCF